MKPYTASTGLASILEVMGLIPVEALNFFQGSTLIYRIDIYIYIYNCHDHNITTFTTPQFRPLNIQYKLYFKFFNNIISFLIALIIFYLKNFAVYFGFFTFNL